jgi:DNA-3-methyladenine glycosylase I
VEQLPRSRCFGGDDPLMTDYHDTEWGTPVRDGRLLFEHLVLDGFQAGLSWRTILHKRQAFRRAFDDFDPERIARYGRADLRRLLADPGIVRNRSKIQATIANARAYLDLQASGVPFDVFLWSFCGGRVLRNRSARSWREIPTTRPESDAVSTALIAHGFRFVGSTICYAFMQAVGMVDDHLVTCFRYQPPEPGAA